MWGHEQDSEALLSPYLIPLRNKNPSPYSKIIGKQCQY